MYLKTITLRGFKSFASATVMRLEPGVTCVVGPNGSGKSNVVDALTWVMGEQGAKNLRGAQMTDVIFAGTSSKPALGRAEVALTIDNSDGLLPIEYTEVEISRTLYRNGGSEYAINGNACRLIDIQELLSDTGMGKNMHVIVGQGRLDTVLQATAEDRRAFIEEAAGVIKHRRRKEKALRKLESMSGSITRISDITTEIRRQLGPLAKQAEVARRASVVQADLRDAKLRLIADDLHSAQSSLQSVESQVQQLFAQKTRCSGEVARARTVVSELEKASAASTPEIKKASEQWYALVAVREQLRSLREVASERSRLLGKSSDDPQPKGDDPQTLETRAKALREEERALEQELAQAKKEIENFTEKQKIAETAERLAEQELADASHTLADRKAGLARLGEQVKSHKLRLESGQQELVRLEKNQVAIESRHAIAAKEYTQVESQIALDEANTDQIVGEISQAEDLAKAAKNKFDDAQKQLEIAQADYTAAKTRVETLSISLSPAPNIQKLIDANLAGLYGTFAQDLKVEAGWEEALSVILGDVLSSLAVQNIHSALQVVEYAQKNDCGAVNLLILSDLSADEVQKNLGEQAIATGNSTLESVNSYQKGERLSVKEQAETAKKIQISPLLEKFSTKNLELWHTLRKICQDWWVGADRQIAIKAAQAGYKVITAVGECFTPTTVTGGQRKASSSLTLQSTYQEAKVQVEKNQLALTSSLKLKEKAYEDFETARVQAQNVKLSQNTASSKIQALSEKLKLINRTMRDAGQQLTNNQLAITRISAQITQDKETLEQIEERLEKAQNQEQGSGFSLEEITSVRNKAVENARQIRNSHMEARLEVRTLEERIRSIKGRAASLERAARAERNAREQAIRKARKRVQQSEIASTVEEAARVTLDVIDRCVEQAAMRRDAIASKRDEHMSEISQARDVLDKFTQELGKINNQYHQYELSRTEKKLQVKHLEQQALTDLGMEPQVLVEEFGPHKLVPVLSPASGKNKTSKPIGKARRVEDSNLKSAVKDKQLSSNLGEDTESTTDVELIPYVREEQEQRLVRAERDLQRLGKVNPLAIEEHAALEERHQFIVSQLEDIKQSQSDLQALVKEIDLRIKQVFQQAFSDTAEKFTEIFPKLFPGGEGKLLLTNPEDMINTGIEVEARPAGKKVKRLSILSGGERSLTAIALLVSIFMARPSPFYVMDEVEAALDDANLGRLLEVLQQLQKDSQLIIITHQKRTMEIADALYGVTMGSEGISKVISQRLEKAS